MLINYFLLKIGTEEGKRIKSISPPAMEMLTNYDWPGNVRELKNIIERMVVLLENDQISQDDLPGYITNKTKMNFDKNLAGAAPPSFLARKEEFEKNIILDVLKKTEYVQTKAAEMLGTSRRMLRYKMDKLGIRKPAE